MSYRVILVREPWKENIEWELDSFKDAIQKSHRLATEHDCSISINGSQYRVNASEYYQPRGEKK